MRCRPETRSRRGGYATVIVLIVLVLMTALIALNYEVVVRLHRRVRTLEERQIQRWQRTEPPPAAAVRIP
ncbi:MAG: hypothetical protein J0L84_06045 [Verrucomicrobia bacterium]|nr:hypothetical protein [Verrucomicrobiota bacterium]